MTTRKKPRRKTPIKIHPKARITSLDQVPTITPMDALPPGTPNPYWSPPSSIADAIQVGGAHYKKFTDPAQQHWNLVVAYGWDYFTSQCTKYLFRWPFKGGVEDLKKARHYLDKLIELVENGWLPDWQQSEAWDNSKPGKGYTKQD